MSEPILAGETPRQPGGRRLKTLVMRIFGGSLVLYALLCLASAMWMSETITVLDSDLAQSSWNRSFRTAEHVRGIFAVGLTITLALLGAVLGLLKQSWRPVLLAACLGTFVLYDMSSTFHVGVASDAVRVGCFNYNSKECRELLNVDASTAPSMYASTAVKKKKGRRQLADWYLADTPPARTNPLFMLPGGMLVTAPYYALHIDAINAKLALQRATVAQFKADHPPATVSYTHLTLPTKA